MQGVFPVLCPGGEAAPPWPPSCGGRREWPHKPPLPLPASYRSSRKHNNQKEPSYTETFVFMFLRKLSSGLPKQSCLSRETLIGSDCIIHPKKVSIIQHSFDITLKLTEFTRLWSANINTTGNNGLPCGVSLSLGLH